MNTPICRAPLQQFVSSLIGKHFINAPIAKANTNFSMSRLSAYLQERWSPLPPSPSPTARPGSQPSSLFLASPSPPPSSSSPSSLTSGTCPRPIRAIFVDLDGTLLNSHHEISPENKAAFAAARSRGILVCLATGRSLSFVKNALTAEDQQFLEYDGTPGVYANGSVVYQETSPTSPLSFYLEPHVQTEVIDFLEAVGMLKFCIAYSDGKVYIEHENENTLALKNKMKDCTPIHLDPARGDACFRTIRMHKLICVNSPETLDELRKSCGSRFDGKVKVIKSAPHLLEFADFEHTKAFGVQKILEKYGINKEDAIAIGDSENDLEMLEYVGIGVAVENAFKSVKRVAKFAAVHHNDHALQDVWVQILEANCAP